MFAADAATFLVDFGSPVRWQPSAGGGTRLGTMIFDQPELVQDNDVQSRQYQVTFEAAAWPGLVRGEVLVIDGEGRGASYRLRTDPRPADDGVFSVAPLAKV